MMYSVHHTGLGMATCAKMVNIKWVFYGFSSYFIETSN